MRIPARLLLTGAIAFVSASCVSDQPVGPSGVPSVAGNPALRALAVAQTVDLVIPANGGDISVFGVYQLHFPANAVCDPNAADTQAGYAAEAWDSACTPTSGDVAIRATAKWSNGRLAIDFAPALRFVPSKNVTLSTGVFAPIIQYYNNAGMTVGFPMYFAQSLDAAPVADALTDASVRTVVVGSSGQIYRRIKHFTGYQIYGTTTPCDPLAGDPLCVWVDDDN